MAVNVCAFSYFLLPKLACVVLCPARVHTFGAQVESFESPSWRFGWLFGVYVGSCGAQINVWEAQTLQRGGWEGLGLAQGGSGFGSESNMDPT